MIHYLDFTRLQEITKPLKRRHYVNWRGFSKNKLESGEYNWFVEENDRIIRFVELRTQNGITNRRIPELYSLEIRLNKPNRTDDENRQRTQNESQIIHSWMNIVTCIMNYVITALLIIQNSVLNWDFNRPRFIFKWISSLQKRRLRQHKIM